MDFDYDTLKLIQEEFQNDFISPQTEINSDSILARQGQFQKEFHFHNSGNNRNETSDLLLARTLQNQFEREHNGNKSYGDLVYDKKTQKLDSTKSLVDPSWEVIDPTPDIHVLFMAFNSKFFWGKLDSVCVSWSKRMKRCAGICSYQGRGGLCHITLSEPLLKLRPRKDLIETLLHEMIHALLFVTHNNKDRDGHGPEFHKHMFRINKEAGTNITVYHSFHDEVELYLQHWWRCDGPCQKWKPYFGIVRRSSNRAPGPYDRWWGQHSRSCGGTFIKIKSPEPKVKAPKKTKEIKPVNTIRKFISNSVKSVDLTSTPSANDLKPQAINKAISTNDSVPNIHRISKPNSGLATSITIASKTNNIHGFSNSSNKSFVRGGTKINSNTIVVNKIPARNTSSKNVDNQNQTSNNTKISQNIENSISNENLIDYNFVRNHWVNKFSNTQNNPQSSNKRKSSEIIPVVSKALKIDKPASQDSFLGQRAPCPVCNISYLTDELNRHLDICLSEPKNNRRECIICLEEINEHEYQTHVNICVEKNFDDNSTYERTPAEDNSVIVIDDDIVNYEKCLTCENSIPVKELNEHMKICKNRTECPECGKKVELSSYDFHLADCLMKKLDAMDQHFDDEDLNKENSEHNLKSITSGNAKESINCLVCGRDIIKNNLYSHLDECVKEVFEVEEAGNEDVDEDDKLYNCPFCLKLLTEIDMSDHIDQCLKTVDCDSEAERNKSLFLSEIN